VALPVLLRVTVLLELLPTATWPNAKLVGDTVNIGAGAAVAVPVRPTGEIWFPALLERVMLPEWFPTVPGENVTVASLELP
jgi:hypothetical protein